ncbi:MAG: ABC-F family ATP-binding cassette domain-containing protein [Myxococcales bacterium]|nr:ABC-F family ATP-binding cassette domain-containing protein [Myxococcales bacterium]
MLVQLDGVSKSFADRTLFSGLNWQLAPGERIGLIGANGAGKSTLFSILSGRQEPDSGRVVIPKGWTIGLLPQELDTLSNEPILELVLRGRSDLLELEDQMKALEERIHSASIDEAQALSESLGELQHRFEHGGGYTFRATAQEILTGMGFGVDEFERPASELSGGWRMRVALAQLLVMRPNVLLMDEPTNHLDVPSLEWIEGFLGAYEGTVVVISHDRYFLNRLVNSIAAIELNGFSTFPGNYDEYQEDRAIRLDQLRRQKAQQDKQVKETERFIERFRSKATKAKQVQSRVKQLEKVERIELPEERRSVTFRFPESIRPGKRVLIADKVAKSFGPVQVYSDRELVVERGDRVALVGPNGHGKTTLLRMLAGETRADAGVVELGHNVELGYYAQHQVESLDLSRTILDEMQEHAPPETRPNCRSILGAFLFSGDEVEKKISVLSGGERSRVALAKLLLRPSNVLLLDEPTNHLDIVSRDVLASAIDQYGGTVVLVSHDRRFINQLATKVVHVENGQAIVYPGDYDYYRFKRTQERDGQPATTSAGDQTGPTLAKSLGAQSAATLNSDLDRKSEKKRQAQLRNELHNRTKSLRARLEKTEKLIAQMEKRIEEIDFEMANPDLYKQPERLASISQERKTTQDELDSAYHDWAELSERIEMVEKQVKSEFA